MGLGHPGASFRHVARLPDGTEDFRVAPWRATHLRTWKRWLWDLVKDDDLRDDEGRYFRVAVDLAVMIPLLELCGTRRARHISEPIYHLNRQYSSRTDDGRYRSSIATIGSFALGPPIRGWERRHDRERCLHQMGYEVSRGVRESPGTGRAKPLRVPHRFLCLTDNPRGIDRSVETKPFVEDLPGWWNKIALFQSRIHDLQGTLLYLDLDMVIIRNIDDVVSHPGDFVAVPTFRREGEFATALMRFEIGRYRRVWELFRPGPGRHERNLRGSELDQCVLHGHEGARIHPDRA